jgi:UPF0755 protein
MKPDNMKWLLKFGKYPEMKAMPLILILLTFLILAVAGIRYVSMTFRSVISIKGGNDIALYVRTGSSFEEIIDSLRRHQVLTDELAFRWLARRQGLTEKVIPGRYVIKNNIQNLSLVRQLKLGHQTPVRLVVQNYRTPADMAGKLSRRLEADSVTWLKLFRDESFLAKFQVDAANFFSIIIPNTYEIFWNTEPAAWLEKMHRESVRFWNEKRLQAARQKGLTVKEVITLASIVEKESNMNDEKPMIAGVYLNRLLKKMALQADPTVVYAWQDFSIRRLTGKHLKIDSPYNTYLFAGLPPGPICLPSIASIDAVLHATSHSYLYFCAREDFSGYHRFARTLDEHRLNARKYQMALNHRNIH